MRARPKTRDQAARSYRLEWESVMRGVRPAFWRITWLWLARPLGALAVTAALAWLAGFFRPLVFGLLYGTVLVGVHAAFVLFLHRSGYRSMLVLSRLGLAPGIEWRRGAPCVYDADVDHSAVWVPEPETDEEDARLIADLFGPAPSEADMQAVHEAAAVRLEQQVASAVAESVPLDEAATLLGVPPKRLEKCVARGQVMAVRRDSYYYLPRWQLSAGRLLPGLDHVIAAWSGSALELASWGARPAVDLDGRSPSHALAAGDLCGVLELEASMRAATW